VNKPLKILGTLEILLLISAVIIYFATANANDFSGFAVIYPIFGMVIIGFIGLAYIIIKPKAQRQNKPTSQNKNNIRNLSLIFLFGLPVIYITQFAGAGLYTCLIVMILALMALRGFVSKNLQLLIDIALVALPVILVFYARSLNDDNIFNLTLFTALIFVGLILFTNFKEIRRRLRV